MKALVGNNKSKRKQEKEKTNLNTPLYHIDFSLNSQVNSGESKEALVE